MLGKKVYVLKLNGERELYDSVKLAKSLRNVGSDKNRIDKILIEVEKILYDGIKTKELFKFVHKELEKTIPKSGFKYNLKKAIFDLRVNGGFAFEKFMGKLFEAKGYSVRMNSIMKGKYITHEIDVSAEKDNEKLMVEVKHHNQEGIYESIQTALYVYARFLDLEKYFTQPMLVTSTKFSEQVRDYSKGVGLRLMGWKYPVNDSLELNIEKYKLYPITLLNLPKSKVFEYLGKGIVTIQQLSEEKNLPRMIKKNIDIILEN